MAQSLLLKVKQCISYNPVIKIPINEQIKHTTNLIKIERKISVIGAIFYPTVGFFVNVPPIALFSLVCSSWHQRIAYNYLRQIKNL